jgi:acetyl-CoA carboxylase biotin carboxyl carrier protein
MNIEYISSLVDLFERSSLSELRIAEEGQEICLKREKEIQTAIPAPPAAPPVIPQETVHETAETTEHEQDTIIISSPIVGTFYRTPAPDAPPFIEVGDTVQVGDTLCIIEAMKMMNRLEAEFPCEIVAIHAEHGKLVEYGGALIEVRRL